MMNKELVILKTFGAVTAIGVLIIMTSALKNSGNQKFHEIDVERINIVEKDGTVKMIITNVEHFPNGSEIINGRPTNENRKKRSGMIFFNEDGIEAGGLIYDGKKNDMGHSAGFSLTFDQYDGDQVMQLLTQDRGDGEERFVGSSLMFNDRPSKESQLKTMEIMKELEELRKKDVKLMKSKYLEYKEQGLLGGVPRVMLGKTGSENNGLFLFDDRGMPRAMFFVDKENNAKLEFYDDNGNTIASIPEKND